MVRSWVRLNSPAVARSRAGLPRVGVGQDGDGGGVVKVGMVDAPDGAGRPGWACSVVEGGEGAVVGEGAATDGEGVDFVDVGGVGWDGEADRRGCVAGLDVDAGIQGGFEVVSGGDEDGGAGRPGEVAGEAPSDGLGCEAVEVLGETVHDEDGAGAGQMVCEG